MKAKVYICALNRLRASFMVHILRGISAVYPLRDVRKTRHISDMRDQLQDLSRAVHLNENGENRSGALTFVLSNLPNLTVRQQPARAVEAG